MEESPDISLAARSWGNGRNLICGHGRSEKTEGYIGRLKENAPALVPHIRTMTQMFLSNAQGNLQEKDTQE